ncbi:unnamed protein product, partial [Polarella glacialis]
MLDAALRSALGTTKGTQARCISEFPETSSCLQDEFISFDGTLTTVYEGEDAATKSEIAEVPRDQSMHMEDLQVLKIEYRRLRSSLPALQRRRAEAAARLDEMEEMHRLLQSELDEGIAGRDRQVADTLQPEPVQLPGLEVEALRRDDSGVELSQDALRQLVASLQRDRQEAAEHRAAAEASQRKESEAEAALAAWKQEQAEICEIVAAAGADLHRDALVDVNTAVQTLLRRQIERNVATP